MVAVVAMLTSTNSGEVRPVTRASRGHNEVGLALEAAGNSVLGVVEVAADESASESQPVVVSHAAKSQPLAERLRELADLHRDGILSVDEFAAARGMLLAGLRLPSFPRFLSPFVVSGRRRSESVCLVRWCASCARCWR